MNGMSFYAKRLAICVLIFVIYVFAWRPVRTFITESVVYPQLNKARVSVEPPPYSIKKDGVSLRISFFWHDKPKTIQYRPQAGFFFLVAIMSLVFITLELKWYLMLIGLHLSSTICSGFLLLMSRSGWYPGFIMVDFLVTYFMPAITLAFVAWMVSINRTNNKGIKTLT